jgi:tagatose 6-phosphate kinase
LKTVQPFLNKGISWVIISRGKNGALFFKRDRFYDVRVPNVNAVNAVGCGDALAAGFTAGLMHQWPDEKIVRYASAVATAHALTPVPGEVRISDIKKIEKGVTCKIVAVKPAS